MQTKSASVAEKQNNKNFCMEQCLLKIAKGEKEAIGQLYDLIQTDVFAFALSKLGNKSDAEDIMQDTFVQVYKNATQYEPKGKPMAWIVTIELNLIRRHFQLKKRNVSIDESAVKNIPQSSFEGNIINDAFLNQLMSNLSEEEREIIVLHVVSGLKHREIAQILEKPLATILSKYNRAIKKLQEISKEVK